MSPSPTRQALERHVSASAAATLAERFTPRHLDRGEPLMGEGRQSHALHLVLRGNLDVSLEGPDGRLIVGHIGPDTWVGEAGFLDGEGATADVIATTEAELLVLDRADFAELTTHQPAAAAELLRVLCEVLADRVHSSSSGLLASADEHTLEVTHPEAGSPRTLLGFLASLFGGRSHG